MLAFKLCSWDGRKKRLTLLSMLSRRAAKRAYLSLVDTETKLEGRSSRAATLAVESQGRRWVGPWRRRAAAAWRFVRGSVRDDEMIADSRPCL